MNFGYVFFVLNEKGDFRQIVVIDRDKLEDDEINEGDEIITRLPLTEKSLLAFKALEAIETIEEIGGSDKSSTSLRELIQWLVEKSSKTSFALGRQIGQKEQSELHFEIDKLASGEF